jgi:hypothetical protein
MIRGAEGKRQHSPAHTTLAVVKKRHNMRIALACNKELNVEHLG